MDVDDPTELLEPASTRVRDPVSGRSVWLAGVVAAARVVDGTFAYELRVGADHDAATRKGIASAVAANLHGLGWEGPVVPKVVEPAAPAAPRKAPVAGMAGPGMGPHGGPIVRAPLPGVKHIVAVASGKGGVGKSTIAANLAVGLRKLGLRTGLVDADVHGPSVPILMNAGHRPGVDREGFTVPVGAYGVRCLSMGQLVDPDEAMIWRGPMVQGAVRQLLQQTRWGELDVLVVDLPPGTGDAQLTLVQAVPLAGAVIVTTPQEVALADAVRGIAMFRQLEVPLFGLVENMAWYELPDGTRDHVFGDGGGVRTAEAYGLPVLGRIPLRSAVRRSGDQGLPAVLGSGDTAERMLGIARGVAEALGLPTA